MAAASGLTREFALRPHAADGNGMSMSPGPGKIHSLSPADGSTNQQSRNVRDKLLIAQFRFQAFKKCFYVKCQTIFVPGDFKASSPRRMFCSVECFEAHWREKLCKHSERVTH